MDTPGISQEQLEKVVEGLAKGRENEKDCIAKGHPGEKVTSLLAHGYYPLRAQCYCKDCGSWYIRAASDEESR